MKRPLLLPGCVGFAILGILAAAKPGYTTAAYNREFKTLYVHEDKTDNVSKSLAAAVKKAGCMVCHVPNKPKKGHYNAYGKQLSKLLRKGDDKDSKKIREALKKVFTMAVDPDVPDITFGSRIHRGKLPAGD
jgi:hypothetical protein